jgi:hypothetical protein
MVFGMLVLLACSNGGGSGNLTASRELDAICTSGSYTKNDRVVVGKGMTDDMCVVQLNEGGEIGLRYYPSQPEVLVAGKGTLAGAARIVSNGEPTWKGVPASSGALFFKAEQGQVFILDMRGTHSPDEDDGCM